MTEQTDRIWAKARKLFDLAMFRKAREAIGGGVQLPWTSKSALESLPAIGSGCLPFWIPANYWATGGKDRLISWIDACAARGAHFGMEVAGWAETSALLDDARLSVTIELLKVAVERCRRNNQWCFPSILNDNCHLSKYGNVGFPLSSVWGRCLALAEAVRSMGPDNLLVQPVAETQTADGAKFENHCSTLLAGFRLVYNGDGGTPGGPARGWPLFAYHPQKTSSSVPRGCLAVSDCGTIIAQLHVGYDGAAKPDVLEEWAAKMRTCGALVAGDYAFKYNGAAADSAGIEALVKGCR